MNALLLRSALCCSAFVALAHPQEWGLSGKVVDAEEGNGLNAVQVSLARAGLRTTTIKNGTWTLGTVSGTRGAASRDAGASESFLHLERGRLLLRIDGSDLLGRHWGHSVPRRPSPQAARALANVSDTLVYTRAGFIEKRVPITSSVLTGIVDSIRRIRHPGWIDSSHSNGHKPDTADAFPDTLRSITLRISKADWDRMIGTFTAACGPLGTRPNCPDSTGGIDSDAMIWIPVDMEADGQIWKHVGMRLKGEGSLAGSWEGKRSDLPFRLNMDMFEDSFPIVKNQRFHGFKKLSFFNTLQDESGIREPIAGEVFRRAGIPSAMSVPVMVRIVHGDIGDPAALYDMVEAPDNPLLNRFFHNDSGTLYKPLSDLKEFNLVDFADPDLKTDFADVKALISAINASDRKTDPAAWRRRLEGVMDMPGFIHWLALSSTMVSYDTYGFVSHNYYLFNDRGIFRWIPYDMGISLNSPDYSIWYNQEPPTTAQLVISVLEDPAYCREYVSRIEQSISETGVFSVKSFEEMVDRYGRMVAPFTSTVEPRKDLRTFGGLRASSIRKMTSSSICP